MAELRVLGAGSALPRAGFGPSGYALVVGGQVTLLDCGPGSVRALGGAGLAIGDVRRVVLSHYHLDHCLDLFALIFARRNPTLGTIPTLDIHGPPGLERLVTRAPEGLGPSAVDPDARLFETELDGSGAGGFEVPGMRFRCVANGHTDVSLSWRVDGEPDGAGPWSLAYTGDTNEDPAVARLARGVELFVAECSFAEEHATPNHLTPQGAARLARTAGVERLLLTHFYPGLDPVDACRSASAVFAGAIESAHDGSVHALGR